MIEPRADTSNSYSTTQSDGDAATQGSIPSKHVNKVVIWAIATVAAAAFMTLVVFAPEGVRLSSDEGAPVIPLWMAILPTAAGILLIRVLPLRAPSLSPLVTDPRAVRRSTVGLLSCAAAFPLVVGLANLSGSALYLVAKTAILLALPAALLWRSRRSIAVLRPSPAWQWWPPIAVVASWTWLSQASPWLTSPSLDWPDPVTLVIGATLTLLTAGIGEELFYRWWLQTRLEALLGRWGGIALASLAFSLMHLGGDRQGHGPVVEVAAAIVVQGSFGLMVGYLWSKYRNLWLAITAHAISNGYGVVAYLVVDG